MSKILLGVCDKCANPNVRELHNYKGRYLCIQCYNQDADEPGIKRMSDARFVNDLRSIVRGVRS